MVNKSASKSSPSTPHQMENKEQTSGKKLKQTRLSFLPKDNGGGGDSLRKRKLSSPETVQDRSVKIVRRENDPPEDPIEILDDVVQDDKQIPEVVEEDVHMVEIIACEDSNSVAPSSLADTSLIEEVPEDEISDGEQEDQPNESVNLDNSVSEDSGEDKGGIASLLEPPTIANGKPMTPRQLEKSMERKSKTEEKLRQKMERDRLLEEKKKEREEAKRKEKEEKEAARQEKEAARLREKEEKEAARLREKEEKEAARQREKEEREAAKQREKEEKDRKRQLELEQKNEEKRRREEQKEEERRKKEEEKRQKELEEENKRKRASQAFTKFFKVGPKPTAVANDDDSNLGGQKATSGADDSSNDVVEMVNPRFMPFAVKGDMKLAPTVRRMLSKEAKSSLEKVLQGEADQQTNVTDLYLKSLKTKTHVPLKGTRTWRVSDTSDEDSEDDLMVVDDALAHRVEEIKPKKEKYRAKFLLFTENRRPAYYGTWQKKSKLIGPRKPFGKDEKFFDYEVDSDEEWEEEEPGESLHGSDDEKEKESEDDYEVDNEFFVPHGHLSDEELQNEDNEMDDNSPEAQKVKLKLLQDEFNDEMKKKTEKIKPRLIGCIWVDEKGGRPENCPQVFWDLLQFRAVLSAGPIVLRAPLKENEADQGDEEADAEDNDNAEKLDKRKGQGLSEEDVRTLIRLVHGNVNSNKFIVKEFQKHLESKGEPRVVTNMSILRKIREMAKWESSSWVVQKEFLERHEMPDLSTENTWQYTLTPKRVKLDKKPPVSPQVAAAVPTQQASTTSVTAPATGNPKTPVRPVAEKESPPSAKQKNNRNSITQFTKVLTTEEKQKQFQAANVASPKANQIPASANENKAPTPTEIPKATSDPVVAVVNPPTQVKKRVPLLMSVPRGQAISEQSKNLLIKDFLKKQPETELKKANAEVVTAPKMVAETIVLD